MGEIAWTVTVGGSVFDLKLKRDSGEGEYLIEYGQGEGITRQSRASLNHIHGDRYLLNLDNTGTHLLIRRAKGGYIASLSGHQFKTQVEATRLYILNKEITGDGGGIDLGEINAPMPGLVLTIEVEEGAVISKGDGIAVVESMKMENLIKSSIGGKVDKVLVEAGQVVDRGDPLVRVVPED